MWQPAFAGDREGRIGQQTDFVAADRNPFHPLAPNRTLRYGFEIIDLADRAGPKRAADLAELVRVSSWRLP